MEPQQDECPQHRRLFEVAAERANRLLRLVKQRLEGDWEHRRLPLTVGTRHRCLCSQDG